MKQILKLLLLLQPFFAFAQPPAGYYQSATGLYGEDLKDALHNIIKNHNQQSYSSLWVHFQSTDKKPDGTVWDIYSDVPGGSPAYVYQFTVNQCGNYAKEGDCYNREHSFPQSWFGSAMPMYSDLFHIYPTDGFVNNKRSNIPFGEVSSPSYTSSNGTKRGPNTTQGYSLDVWEPLDEYKGDLARSYFYMLVRYKEKLQEWNTPILSGSHLEQWAYFLLLDWAKNDPVSQKEKDRNNAIYQIQKNRNPFIDNPEWVEHIWVPGMLVNNASQRRIKLWATQTTVYFSGNDAGKEGVLEVLNFSGQKVAQFNVDTAEGMVRANLPTGLYFLCFSGEAGSAVQKVFITSN
jgi:endonuclease I